MILPCACRSSRRTYDTTYATTAGGILRRRFQEFCSRFCENEPNFFHSNYDSNGRAYTPSVRSGSAHMLAIRAIHMMSPTLRTRTSVNPSRGLTHSYIRLANLENGGVRAPGTIRGRAVAADCTDIIRTTTAAAPTRSVGIASQRGHVLRPDTRSINPLPLRMAA
jgi:hypothetical protein